MKPPESETRRRGGAAGLAFRFVTGCAVSRTRTQPLDSSLDGSNLFPNKSTML